jgi:hypothetical protein
MKIFANVPENTIPYKCGERVMACIVETNEAGQITNLIKCVEFFKSCDDAREWQKSNPEYQFNYGGKK